MALSCTDKLMSCKLVQSRTKLFANRRGLVGQEAGFAHRRRPHARFPALAALPTEGSLLQFKNCVIRVPCFFLNFLVGFGRELGFGKPLSGGFGVCGPKGVAQLQPCSPCENVNMRSGRGAHVLSPFVDKAPRSAGMALWSVLLWQQAGWPGRSLRPESALETRVFFSFDSWGLQA